MIHPGGDYPWDQHQAVVHEAGRLAREGIDVNLEFCTTLEAIFEPPVFQSQPDRPAKYFDDVSEVLTYVVPDESQAGETKEVTSYRFSDGKMTFLTDGRASTKRALVRRDPDTPGAYRLLAIGTWKGDDDRGVAAGHSFGDYKIYGHGSQDLLNTLTIDTAWDLIRADGAEAGIGSVLLRSGELSSRNALTQWDDPEGTIQRVQDGIDMAHEATAMLSSLGSRRAYLMRTARQMFGGLVRKFTWPRL